MFEDQTGTYSDSTIHCPDCNQDFTWTAGEKKFFDSKQLTSPPKRCKPCRDAKKEARGNTEAASMSSSPPASPYTGEDRGNERRGGGGGKGKSKKSHNRGGNGYSQDSGRAKQVGKIWGEDAD